MDEMTEKYDALKRIHDSTNKTVEYYEKENKRLNAAIQLLLAEKVQWIQSKELQQQIMHQQLTASNKENNVNLEEIVRLRAEIKKLRNEE